MSEFQTKMVSIGKSRVNTLLQSEKVEFLSTYDIKMGFF